MMNFSGPATRCLKNNIWKKKGTAVALFQSTESLRRSWICWVWRSTVSEKTWCFADWFGRGQSWKRKRHVSPAHVSKSFLSIIDHLYFHTRHVDMIENFKKMMRLLWMYPLFLQALHLFLAQKTSKLQAQAVTTKKQMPHPRSIPTHVDLHGCFQK